MCACTIRIYKIYQHIITYYINIYNIYQNTHDFLNVIVQSVMPIARKLRLFVWKIRIIEIRIDACDFEPIKISRFMSFSRVECAKKRISKYDHRIYSQSNAMQSMANAGQIWSREQSRFGARSNRVFWKELRNAFARISSDNVAAKYEDKLFALFVHVMKHERPMLTIEKKMLSATVWNDDMKI